MAEQEQLAYATRLVLGAWVAVVVVAALWFWAVNSDATLGSGAGLLAIFAVGLILGVGLVAVVITLGLIRTYFLGSQWESAAAVVGPPVVLGALFGAFALMSRFR